MKPALQRDVAEDDVSPVENPHHRDAIMQRVQIGLTGLATVFLLTLLAASIFSLLGHDDQHATALANGVVVSNSAATAADEPPREPLAELGVAPGGNMPRRATAPAPVGGGRPQSAAQPSQN